VSVVLSLRRADGLHRKVGIDRAEVSRGRSTGRDRVAGREGPNVECGGGVGVARAGRGDRSHPSLCGPLLGGDGEVR
jgi:hypothetical protein